MLNLQDSIASVRALRAARVRGEWQANPWNGGEGRPR